MAAERIKSPLLVIVGETASGKSALAIKLAERFGGAVICADSRTVYKDMDIGTAKPSQADRTKVPHYGLDLVSPDEPFTAADFKDYADRTLARIADQDKLPVLVGGTGLYVDAVLYDYSFRSPPEPELRQQLSAMTVGQLQERLAGQGIPLPENAQNPRHLIRAIETGGQVGEAGPLRANTLILGLSSDREMLRRRIEDRVEAMVAEGFIVEVTRLAETYGWEAPAMQAPGYKAFRQYLEGTASMEEARALFIKNDMNLAKRQRTWFRRNKSIHWLPTGEEYEKSVELITTLMNK